ncbi:hypothetical protein [Mesobacillus foraminis]|uniref:hypothetical protein n=1 Tax=Mesobacillus foraminis TaxID=279826 RepID=UPI000EF5135D|nr:hypothetical protein [Mesobacillus foraminis]
MKSTKTIMIVIFMLGVIIIGLQNTAQYGEVLRVIGFILFTILCLLMAVENRKSKGKVIVVLFFWLILGVNQII